jgi:hypothetical protein
MRSVLLVSVPPVVVKRSLDDARVGPTLSNRAV